MGLLAAGCKDDRKIIAAALFNCDPNSHTADDDCGDNFRCYTATQAVGRSICVPACDPKEPKKGCPDGLCTHGGECLTRCRVENGETACRADDQLSCVRITYSDLEDDAKNGVCLPIAFSCEESSDCFSPVYNLCTSETNGQQWNPTLARSGSICAQGNCDRDGVACEPGSTCIRKVLPSTGGEIPDVCTPNCQRRELADKTLVDQCVVGFTCLNQAFPQTDTRVCSPGFAGWICDDPLGCVVGDCAKWDHFGERFSELKTCSPKCVTDEDCAVYDQEVNPTAFTHFTCQKGLCRNLQAIFFTEFCLRDGAACQMDPSATCHVGKRDSDAGILDVPNCPGPPMAPIPLSKLGGLQGTCIRPCTTDTDCAEYSDKTHVTHSCVAGECSPSLPFIMECHSDASCFPGTTCQMPTMGVPPYPVCTASCTGDQDCAVIPTLGSNYLCLGNQCVPKVESGCAPFGGLDSACLSGRHLNGLCVSPKGWLCERAEQCASGICTGGERIKHCE